MKDLIISSTDETPEISFKTSGELLIKGVSIPENVSKFYAPVTEWLEELRLAPPQHTRLVFEIEYINTSSSRSFIDISRRIAAIKNAGNNASIVWRYMEDDEDNLELGKDLEYSAKIDFIFETIS